MAIPLKISKNEAALKRLIDAYHEAVFNYVSAGVTKDGIPFDELENNYLMDYKEAYEMLSDSEKRRFQPPQKPSLLHYEANPAIKITETREFDDCLQTLLQVKNYLHEVAQGENDSIPQPALPALKLTIQSQAALSEVLLNSMLTMLE
jgi:hypothetical protein